jgi:hypothetical protein
VPALLLSKEKMSSGKYYWFPYVFLANFHSLSEEKCPRHGIVVIVVSIMQLCIYDDIDNDS